MLKNLTQSFGSRSVLDLHDGNKGAAWTNLLAETRLVTAWETEPVEISQLVRFACATPAYNATWQVLQADGWPDDQLARLQAEWEAVDFFKNLPEIAAFQRASLVAECRQERNPPLDARFSLTEFSKEALQEALQHPSYALYELIFKWKHSSYLKHGSYEDEKNLLLFYRDRELELRNAVQASTWSQMRQLPGVTNKVFFQSKYSSRVQTMMNLHEMSMSFLKQGSGFLGRAAEAEARRRILITAIALERYRGKHGLYPKTLAELAPESLKTVPVDFMDGQPLRYRLTDDGHFILYSIGLDCVDDGGKIQTHEQRIQADREGLPFDFLPEADIVWPRPATAAEMADARQQEKIACANKTDEIEELQTAAQWPRQGKILTHSRTCVNTQD